MGRKLAEASDLTNTFIEDRVSTLLPVIEQISKQKIKAREVGWGKGSNRHIGWKALARDESVVFKTQYPDVNPDGSAKAESELRYRSAWAQIANLNKALRQAAKTDLKDSAQYHPCLTVIEHFSKQLYTHFSVYKTQSNIEYKKRVKERKKVSNRIEIDLTQYLHRANEVLTDVGSDKDIHYTDVSCAVALCTGRRMAEVHLSANFQPHSEYELKFTGQLKGKGRKEYNDGELVKLRKAEFIIPTLVKADLVLAGMNYLQGNGKRFSPSEDTLRVNGRFSKPLSKTVKESWDFMGNRDTTYHKFRGAYFMANVTMFDKDVTEFEEYATEIMGDNDMTTISSYMIYTLSPDSITRV